MADYVYVADLFDDGAVDGLEVQGAVAKYLSANGYQTPDLKTSGGGLGGYVRSLFQSRAGSAAKPGPTYANAPLYGNAPGGGGPVYANAPGGGGPVYANAPGGGGPVYANASGYKGYAVYSGPPVPVASPPPAPRTRPLPPGGPRSAVTQSAMGQTRSVLPMDGAGYAHDRDHEDTVVYMDAERRAKHEVVMGARLTRRGAVFDTAQIRKGFNAKARSGATQNRPGQANLGGGIAPEELQRWNKESLIWVCSSSGAATKPQFYSGVGKLNHIHHSSFNGGQAVVGAGEWIVIGGELRVVSANSGHYRPTMDALYAALLHMSQAFNTKTQVMMYDTRTSTWVYRPVRDVISKPSDGGRYKVHPQS